jgi:putative ABC transport system substrate-binding protein
VNRRRALLASLAALAAPSLAQGQGKRGRVYRIGFLGAATAAGYAAHLKGFRQGLRDYKYEEGRNLVIEYRWAEGRYERLPALARELVDARVEVIVTHGTPGTKAAKQATATVPIVMAIIGDAVATGVVPSIARPGGNVTGSSFFNPELAAKRLELIKEAVPRIASVGVLVNPDNPVLIDIVMKLMRETAKALKLELPQFPVRGPAEFDAAFASMVKQKCGAVAFLEDAMFNANAGALVALAAKHRLPATGGREFADAGGLLGYGVNFPEIFRRSVYFIDRILKGAKPGDIPVEQPTKFELHVNLKAAKALGLTIPNAVLVRADRVIE